MGPRVLDADKEGPTIWGERRTGAFGTGGYTQKATGNGSVIALDGA